MCVCVHPGGLLVLHCCQSKSTNLNEYSCFSGEQAGKITLKHVYEIAVLKKQDPVNRHTDLKEMCEMVIECAHTCGIDVVRHLDPEEYGEFLKEREKVVEEQEKALLEAKQAKLLRVA